MVGQQQDPIQELDSNSDVILWLVPFKGVGAIRALNVIKEPENKARVVKARHSPSTQNDIARDERESTEPLKEPTDARSIEDTDCIAVRFSQGGKTSYGVVAGRSAEADILIRNVPGVSK